MRITVKLMELGFSLVSQSARCYILDHDLESLPYIEVEHPTPNLRRLAARLDPKYKKCRTGYLITLEDYKVVLSYSPENPSIIVNDNCKVLPSRIWIHSRLAKSELRDLEVIKTAMVVRKTLDYGRGFGDLCSAVARGIQQIVICDPITVVEATSCSEMAMSYLRYGFIAHGETAISLLLNREITRLSFYARSLEEIYKIGDSNLTISTLSHDQIPAAINNDLCYSLDQGFYTRFYQDHVEAIREAEVNHTLLVSRSIFFDHRALRSYVIMATVREACNRGINKIQICDLDDRKLYHVAIPHTHTINSKLISSYQPGDLLFHDPIVVGPRLLRNLEGLVFEVEELGSLRVGLHQRINKKKVVRYREGQSLGNYSITKITTTTSLSHVCITMYGKPSSWLRYKMSGKLEISFKDYSLECK